ncbi:homocysteine S-methyltransferase family protein [Burkholderia ambifaria]|uniref:homocysteine S-methyltransferase family protein n=1 Tax=Burkholderia ambifaria TaxID=152480 RepID=UPI002FDF13CD
MHDITVDGLDSCVDLWLAETQSLTDEIGAVRRALGDNPKPLWVSFTLRDDVEPGATPVLRSGQALNEAIDAALSAGATALLFNCSQPESMGAAIEMVQRTLAQMGTPLAVGAYANAFPRQRADARGAPHPGFGE